MDNIDHPVSNLADRESAQSVSATCFGIVGIGASAGGLDAFSNLLSSLPLNTGMSFVLVQHLDPHHESALAALLRRVTKLPVVEASDDLLVEPNHIYVSAPNSILSIVGGRLKTAERAPVNGGARTIDTFLESLAEDQGAGAIGVILSGNASDGSIGIQAIKGNGGITFAQNDSASHREMPESAISTGCVDYVLTPAKIASELSRLAEHFRLAGKDDTTPASRANDSGADFDEAYKRVLFHLHRQSGVDFSLYKPATLRRRVHRRMVLNRIKSLDAYASRLLTDEKELRALCLDALISVTTFFRDAPSFRVLQEIVFPKILASRGNQSVRIWIAACSTGQEAYSLAMAFCEVAEQLQSTVKLQVFATDVNEEVLKKARAGSYTRALVQDISPERLARFFDQEQDGYRVKKTIREMFVFARQNLAGDPPFSRLDLISCRNLMIYLESTLQKRLISLFHYALKPEGFLFLGSSETVGSFTDLFQLTDKKHKIYTKLPGPKQPLTIKFETNSSREQLPAKIQASGPRSVDSPLTPQREADRVALQRWAPPAILIDDQFQVLQFRGDTRPYLKVQEGAATHHALEILRDGLVEPLKSAIDEVRKSRQSVRTEKLSIRRDGDTLIVHLEIVPLKNLRRVCYLVYFDDSQGTAGTLRSSEIFKADQHLEPDAAKSLISRLRAELEEVRDFARAHLEQQEATTEELQSSYEEIQSSNEELQSINEELETAKEELESANEELNTVNEEMVSRNTELIRLNADLRNLQESVDTAVVLLDRTLTIRSFTASAEKHLNVLPGDIGRSIGHIQHNLDCADLEKIILRVVETGTRFEREIQAKGGRWYSLRISPYLTLENRIDGAVLMLVDVDALKTSEQAIKVSRDYVENIVHSTRYPLLVLSEDLRVISANAAYYRTFRATDEDTKGRRFDELGERQWDAPSILALLNDVVRRNSAFDDFEISHTFAQLGERTMLINGRRLQSNEANQSARILVAIDDITDSKQLEAVRLSEIRYRRFFEAAKDGIVIVEPTTGNVSDINPLICNLLQLDGPSAVGCRFSELGLFTDARMAEAALAELRATGYYRNADLRVTTKGSGVRQVEIVSNLYTEEDRRVIQFNIRDITERRNAEQAARAASERFRFLTEALPEKIFTARPNGEVDYVNQQWTLFSHLGLDRIGDWGWVQLVHLDDVKENLRRWNHSMTTGEDFQFEHRLRRFDGTYRWHLTRASAMRDTDGEIMLWIGSNTDIDDQKLSAEKLERTVAERTARLSEIIGELESFSYSISHDLRAPLRSIQGFAGFLMEDCGNKVGEQGRNHLHRITSAAHRMDRLIQDILSMSMVASAQLPLSKVDLDKLARGVIESYPNLNLHSAEIEIVGHLPEVIGNEAALTQCLSNLLGNAVKFVKPGTTPRIVIRAEEKETAVRLWVEDNGIGLSPEASEIIFGMFQRLSKSYEGTGIGLSIVKKAIERMGGTVGVSSVVGQGSKFWIELRKIDHS